MPSRRHSLFADKVFIFDIANQGLARNGQMRERTRIAAEAYREYVEHATASSDNADGRL